MKQYFEVKQKYPDAILLFRVGDFYETFGEDAKKAAGILGIVLTARNNGGSKIELAGFPYHSVDTYLPKLVRAGYRVAICEQLEKPSKEKKIVKRGVTDVVTPGVTLHDNILEHKKNNFLCAVYQSDKSYGISFLDISTGEYHISEGPFSTIQKLIQSFMPSELLCLKNQQDQFKDLLPDDLYFFNLDEWFLAPEYGREQLVNHFKVKSLKGFAIDDLELGQAAAGAILHYLNTIHSRKLEHIVRINRIRNDQFMWMDKFTIQNLELIRSNHVSGTALIDVIDQTTTPMGARMLKNWVLLPLIDEFQIKDRLNIVEELLAEVEIRSELDEQFQMIGDLERLTSKIPSGKINPKEINYVNQALSTLPEIQKIISKSAGKNLKVFADQFNECKKLKDRISSTLSEDAPFSFGKADVIKDGYNEELDELRNIVKNSKDILLDLQKREAEATGITSLKIGFNNVFGYYLEVTNKYKGQGLVPESWIRKQTLTNAERYITSELKELEAKILSAEEKIGHLEEQLFSELLAFLMGYIKPLMSNAQLIAKLDCLNGLALLAEKQNYVRPVINDGFELNIEAGRHPVIEFQLDPGTPYVPNDLMLNDETHQIIMITGPNMSGKSAILRQTALIVLLAQMGSFVPANAATIGIVDKLFTRVGASDNISSGESTFMVEMNETSSILNNISPRSLILLDEIGRGTSTYDGISIAWSISEYLHDNPTANPKTLFATHYHELNELAQKFDRIKNYNVSTKEINNQVIFLRKLVEGGSKHSFGIHVAQMAGMPKEIISRAADLLTQLELKTLTDSDSISDTLQIQKAASPKGYQMNFFDSGVSKEKEELLNEISVIDLQSMTPIECMLKLNELKQKLDQLD